MRRLRAKRLGVGYDDLDPIDPQKMKPSQSEDLANDLQQWIEAPPASHDENDEDPEMMAVERRIRKKKGSWWQVPKDLPDPPSKP